MLLIEDNESGRERDFIIALRGQMLRYQAQLV